MMNHKDLFHKNIHIMIDIHYSNETPTLERLFHRLQFIRLMQELFIWFSFLSK